MTVWRGVCPLQQSPKRGKSINKMRWGDKRNMILLWKWSTYGFLDYSCKFGEMTGMLVKMHNNRGTNLENVVCELIGNLIFQRAKGMFQPHVKKCHQCDSFHAPCESSVLVSLSHDSEQWGCLSVVLLEDNTFLLSERKETKAALWLRSKALATLLKKITFIQNNRLGTLHINWPTLSKCPSRKIKKPRSHSITREWRPKS